MDFSALISALTDKGWRIGLPLALAGGVILLAHRWGWPEPGVLQPWLSTATVLGALGGAVTVVAVGSAMTGSLHRSVRRHVEAAQRDERLQREYELAKEKMWARMDILEPFQRQRLLEILQVERGSVFLVRHGDGPSMSLFESRFVIPEGDTATSGYVCQLHPLLQAEREEAISRLSKP